MTVKQARQALTDNGLNAMSAYISIIDALEEAIEAANPGMTDKAVEALAEKLADMVAE